MDKGEAAAKKCAACHTFGKGEPNRVGPNLYGVVGRERGSHAGFNYSAAMKGKPGKWTIEELNTFLQNPKGFIPGTSMSFAGRAARQRAGRPDRLSELEVGQPGAAAEGRGSAGRPEAVGVAATPIRAARRVAHATIRASMAAE